MPANNVSTVGMPLQFDRAYPGPIDKYDVFDSYQDAVIYAQGPLSYAGQVIGVRGLGDKETIYIINVDKTLSNAMMQRENIYITLEADKWEGTDKGPFKQTVAIPYLEPGDNAVVSLARNGGIEHVNQIVQSKINQIDQNDNSITFTANGDRPVIDIPMEVVIGSIISAVEVPNNVNDNTNTTRVWLKAENWKGDMPPYYQEIPVDGMRLDSNGTIYLDPESSYSEKIEAASCGLDVMETKNNMVVVKSMFSKPKRDFRAVIVWGDNIVVFENSDVAEDTNIQREIVLKVGEWTEARPYTQTLRIEGLTEYNTGKIGISAEATPEQADCGISADLQLTEQGNGYCIVEATGIKPDKDIPVTIIYGSNITIVPAPDYVGEANRHADATLTVTRWVESPDGYEQEVEVEGITPSSIGVFGIRQYANNQQIYACATAKIECKRVYDNRVLFLAKGKKPIVNIPVTFVWGRNVNIVKHQDLNGKVALTAAYIPYDDSKIMYHVESVQQVLELLVERKINYTDIRDNLTSHSEDDKTKHVLSANMGWYIDEKKIDYIDIRNNLTSNTDADKTAHVLSAWQGYNLDQLKINFSNIRNNLTSSTELDKTKNVLSAWEGYNLNNLKINYTDIINSTAEADAGPGVAGSSNKKVLSARQGYELDKKYKERTDKLEKDKVAHTDCVNNLTSTDDQNPLSANMGRVLNEYFGNIVLRFGRSKPTDIPNGKKCLWIKDPSS